MNVGKLPFVDFPSVGSALNASQGLRVSIPVSPSSYIYSQFRHVSGVPAQDGVHGVSIAKLHILDTILSEISRLREAPRPSFDIEGDTAEKRMNALVAHFQGQIQEAYASQAENPYHIAAPQAGATLSVSI